MPGRKCTKLSKARRTVTVNKLTDYITAQIMNTHYVAISTDNDYRAPRLKLTAAEDLCLITEMDVFRMLDTLRPTTTELDQIPAWLLRLGAPIFAAPLASLFRQSLATGVVPRQWKTAIIMPTPKIATQPSDFRPISITPVLLRSLERFVVRKYIYPALLKPHLSLDFSDQFVFRPSGSTTVAIAAVLHTVRHASRQRLYIRPRLLIQFFEGV